MSISAVRMISSWGYYKGTIWANRAGTTSRAPLCDENWTDVEAEYACQLLGFSYVNQLLSIFAPITINCNDNGYSIHVEAGFA